MKDWPIYIGGLAAFGAVVSAFTMLGWGWSILVGVVGIAGSFALLLSAKSAAQLLAPVLVVLGYILLLFVR